jgi:hypothetical protein
MATGTDTELLTLPAALLQSPYLQLLFPHSYDTASF